MARHSNHRLGDSISYRADGGHGRAEGVTCHDDIKEGFPRGEIFEKCKDRFLHACCEVSLAEARKDFHVLIFVER